MVLHLVKCHHASPRHLSQEKEERAGSVASFPLLIHVLLRVTVSVLLDDIQVANSALPLFHSEGGIHHFG